MSVSVIVPVYNGEEYIDKCLSSLLNQKTNIDYEIIVVNDGSKDSTEAKLAQYSNEDKIKVFNITNHGVSYARRFGVENANNRYICFVDSDDFVELDYLDTLWNAFQEDVLTICGVKIIYENEEQIREMMPPKVYPCNQAIKLIGENKITANLTTTMFEKSKFLSIPANCLKYCEDTIFVIEYISKYKMGLKLIPNALYNYNMCNQNSATNNYYSAKYLDSFIKVPFMLRDIYEKYQIENIEEYMSLEFTISAVRIFRIINYRCFKKHMNSAKYDYFRKIKISRCKKYPNKIYFAFLKCKIYLPILIIEKLFRSNKNKNKIDYSYDFDNQVFYLN